MFKDSPIRGQRLLFAAPVVTVDDRPEVRGHRPVALVTPNPEFAHRACRIDQNQGRPRGIPRLEVNPHIHAIVAGHLSVGVGQHGERNFLTPGKRGHGVEILRKDASEGRPSSCPLVQLDLEPRQESLAAQSPGMPHKDQAQPSTSEVSQPGAFAGSRHWNIEFRRAITGCERGRAFGTGHGRNSKSGHSGGGTVGPNRRNRQQSYGVTMTLMLTSLRVRAFSSASPAASSG